MVWTMDEITSSDLLYDAENAKSDSEIWKKLAAEVMANVLGQHYFTDIYRDGQPVKYKFANRISFIPSGASGGTLIRFTVG